MSEKFVFTFSNMKFNAICRDGLLEECKVYLKDKKDLTPDEMLTGLTVACGNGQLDIVKYFIEEKRCNPFAQDFDDEDAFTNAAQLGQINVLNYYLYELNYVLEEKQKNILKTKMKPIHFEIIENLVQKRDVFHQLNHDLNKKSKNTGKKI